MSRYSFSPTQLSTLRALDEKPQPVRKGTAQALVKRGYIVPDGTLYKLTITTDWGQDWDEWNATRPKYDANGHQLGYDPAVHKEGKGFILSNGAVWTWPTHKMRPQHMEYNYRVQRQHLSPHPSLSSPGAISAPSKPKDYGTRWKPVVAQEGIYTAIYVTDGKRKVKVGEVWEESGTYEGKLKSLMDKAKKRCNVLDEAM